MRFFDTESVGFSGPPVLIQHQRLGEGYCVFPVWENTVQDFLKLVEDMINEDVLVCFNATHEAFVLSKWYSVFSKVKDKTKNPIPEEIRDLEESLDYSKILCLNPRSVVDLYIVAKQTLFSFAVGRYKRPVEIHNIPVAAAKNLKNLLELFAVQLPKILFEKFKNKVPGDYWEVTPSKRQGFVNFKLNFNPSLKLKSIIKFLFPHEDVQEIEIAKYHQPNEESREYRPWNNEWPRLLPTHLAYWNKERSREYARKDVDYLQRLRTVFLDRGVYPTEDHIDSKLAWHSGNSKARGFCIDNEQLDILLTKATVLLKNIPDTSSQASLAWLKELCPPEFHWLIQNTDTKKTLIPLSKDNTPELSKVVERAKLLMEQRANRKRIDTLSKLQSVGRFHPTFEVAGTLSNRMSGKGGINPQGIIRASDFRAVFLMADEGFNLSGGDFSSQEVTIIDAVINDSALHALLKKSPKNIHNLMAWCIYEDNGKPFEGWKPTKEQYYRAKQTVYALCYGAQLKTLAKSAQISEERMAKGIEKLNSMIPGLKNYSETIKKEFASMVQPNGIGTQIEWNEPASYAISIFGFARSYVLDNQICKFLFDIASKPPKELQEFREHAKVVRKDREQSVIGATQSALYAAAFAIQSENLRTAGNHKIQNPGATVTKILQYNILLIQPFGIDQFHVQLYNVHDELLCVNDCEELIESTVKETIALLRQKIPLLDIDWKPNIGSWAEVKD